MLRVRNIERPHDLETFEYGQDIVVYLEPPEFLAERNSGDGHRATTQAHPFLATLTILPIDIISYILSQMPDDLPTEAMRSRRQFR